MIALGAATLATACSGVARKARINRERSRAIYDVIIIGGSYAGLAAALQLVRARRKVLILDAGQRRNRFAGHSHGFLGQDGQPPGVIATKGKAEVLAYPTVTWKDALATEARRAPDGFVVRAGGDEFRGKRLILATGVVDELPSIPGLSERWGKRVFFCPYCDGYEFGLGSLGVLATSPQSAHFAMIVSEWAAPGQTTFFLNGQSRPDAHELAQLRSRGITIEREPVLSVSGEKRSVDLHLRDGRTTKRDGLFLLPRAGIKGPFAEELGCELETGPLGSYYKTDATKETTVQGYSPAETSQLRWLGSRSPSLMVFEQGAPHTSRLSYGRSDGVSVANNNSMKGSSHDGSG